VNPKAFLRHSLKTRVTLFTLLIFVTGIWSLAFYASRILREDMTRMLGDQQFSTVSLLAAAVNAEMDQQLRSLEAIAGSISPALLNDKAALQSLLEQRQVLQSLFSGGTFATGIDGTAIADVPLSTGRIGANFMEINSVAAALKEGKTTISQPVMGKQLKAPVFFMTAPVRNTQGEVTGALTGVVNLGKPGFLDRIAEGRYGLSGGYVLVASPYRLVVAASDKSRVMGALPAPGITPLIDRYVQGHEGSGIFTNVRGVEVLASAKSVPVAGWYVGVQLPIAEAFAPIHAMQQRLLLATIILTLLAGSLTWWMLRRQLAPMLAAAKSLAIMPSAGPARQALPVTTQDEIGQLIGGFNRLLEAIQQGDDALKENASQLQRLSRRVLEVQESERRRVAIELHDELGQTLTAIKINLQAHERFTGQSSAELNAENIAIVDAALQQVRRLALALRPSMLDDLGLVPALRWICEQTASRSDLIIQFDSGNLQSRLAPEIETACFRIVQEALTNIVRHAKAWRVTIDLQQDNNTLDDTLNDTLEIRIADDGCGFKPDAMRKQALAGNSMGVLGMQERATLIGGQLTIESTPGEGCRLTLRCPLHLREERQ
jgi:signal transduction histidine kinase